MSEIKVNSIKGVGASTAAITVNNTDGTCTANLTNRTNKNLILKGAFLIAQRGVTSTTNGSTIYASFGDQLDMLYADMKAGKLDTTGTWATHIKAVKDANPKPS